MIPSKRNVQGGEYNQGLAEELFGDAFDMESGGDAERGGDSGEAPLAEGGFGGGGDAGASYYTSPVGTSDPSPSSNASSGGFQPPVVTQQTLS